MNLISLFCLNFQSKYKRNKTLDRQNEQLDIKSEKNIRHCIKVKMKKGGKKPGSKIKTSDHNKIKNILYSIVNEVPSLL